MSADTDDDRTTDPPPPGSEDVYSADTVVGIPSPGMLDIIRDAEASARIPAPPIGEPPALEPEPELEPYVPSLDPEEAEPASDAFLVAVPLSAPPPAPSRVLPPIAAFAILLALAIAALAALTR